MTEAMKELVAAAEEAAEWIHERTTHSKIEYLLRSKAEAVKAEEKPQTHTRNPAYDGPEGVFDGYGECDAPIHQTGGK